MRSVKKDSGQAARPAAKTVAEVRDTSPKDRNRVAAVDRAIDVMLAFRLGESSVSLAQLADRTGMYKSTILRLLHTLEGRGFITRLTDGGYRLGAPLLSLGTIYQKSFKLEDVVMPQLKALTDATDESSSFFVSDGKSRFCLYRVEPKQEVRHAVEIGGILRLDRGATGKVLTAFAQGSGATAPDKFKQIPIMSFGVNPLDISVIAGPVFGMGGQLIGAVSLSGPTSRFDTRLRKQGAKALVDILRTITSRLGGDPSVLSAGGIA